MGSGMNGQRFAFHGYLPVQPGKRDAVARTLERRARQENETQILIEAPYRNNRLLEALLRACAPDTLLCLATDLTLPTESIATRSIAQWRRDPPDIDRRPTVFLIGADASAPATAAPRLPPGARRRRGS